MAYGGYPDVHSSVGSHRGVHGGGRSYHFRGRGQGKEMSHTQSRTNRTQSTESDYFLYDKQCNEFDSTTSLRGSAMVNGQSYKGKRVKFRGQGR